MKTSKETLEKRGWKYIDDLCYLKSITQEHPMVKAVEYLLFIDKDYNMLNVEKLYDRGEATSVDEINCLSHELLTLIDYNENSKKEN